MPGTVLLLAASPVGKGCLVDAASVLPVLAAVPPAVLAGTETANVVELVDPLEPQAVLTRLRAAATSPGPLTLFVVGQLQLDRRQRLPHLALARTTPATVRYTGFPWHWFREELRLRAPGSTTVFLDLHADAETWQWLRDNPLDCGPHVTVYGRVAPPAGRRGTGTPSYMKAVGTILRSGGRPGTEHLHGAALARVRGEGEAADLVVEPGTGWGSGVGTTGTTGTPGPGARATASAGAGITGTRGTTGITGITGPVPHPTVPGSRAGAPGTTGITGAPGHPSGRGAADDAAGTTGTTGPKGPAPSPTAPDGAGTTGTTGIPRARTEPTAPAPAPVIPVVPPPAAPAPPVLPAPPTMSATLTAPPVPPQPPEYPLPPPTPRSAAATPADDPHAAITAAVQSGRHAEADALAARQEAVAVEAHGPGSDEALHWAEVRADLAMFAGDAERSCRTWLTVASRRLAAGQPVDAPAVEAAVDRAHHQWGRIDALTPASELAPALTELRTRVPGRRDGALDHIQQQLRQLADEARPEPAAR
ncbi:hypothetical protein IAG44_19380 [Streptomyces roseirectus]|uniref:Uncharacterized protein n=1 Tax=Streptomyces roseirectus TaxID=2768066 RepID=A0A7H0IF15_9ACTN|nr:hypothetical protein [Streptomyces roseirectus]QNP71381.1 hypothetical protein IAG44_19380 [Streptomyces roseirectus]